MRQRSRLFAIVPAAGLSRRMGEPKLLMPFGRGTVISAMLGVLQRPEIVRTIVVVRPDDEPLRAAVTSWGGEALQPSESPEEMRVSVEHALKLLEQDHHPAPSDGWLLCPADHPLLDSTVLLKLIDRWFAGNCRILLPTFQGRRGHPTIFQWDLADEVVRLPKDQGINQIVRHHAQEVVEFEVGTDSILADLDTPEDYSRLMRLASGAVQSRSEP